MSDLDRASAYPSSAVPCPCGDLFIDGVCDACGSCSGCDECAPLFTRTGPVTMADLERWDSGRNVCAVCNLCERAECACSDTHTDCPDCGERVELDGVKPIHESTGDASCPERSTGAVAYGVKREVVAVDRMDYPDHRRVTVQVRYAYPDAPDALLRVVFSQTYGSKPVWMQAGRMEAVMVDDPARFGTFASAPVDWVHSFYADH